ncbi:MAG: phosphatidylglycerophosphatase A [Alphaproteobacteria bacterium]|nr:phosphatidylglycerophosphatase A [Alphaproteobacteria bacterium]
MFNKFRTNYARAKAERSEFLSKVNPFSPAAMVATWFGCGLLLPGPGTWGTVGGFLSLGLVHLISNFYPWGVGIFLHIFVPYILLPSMTVLLLISGWLATYIIGKKSGRYDLSPIIIDKITAVWFLANLMPAIIYSPVWALSAFLIFRIFDICKPWPIKWFNSKIKGARGVMFDDLFVALYCYIIIVFSLATYANFFEDRGCTDLKNCPDIIIYSDPH